ncbi:MAG: hypothetical protein QOE68_1373 [Thermoanaerobaculia bacterium]|nr:hypothetical protein [Thermoanaerobaculia bacterium]
MFGSMYGKAVELFGKALLISAFLPLLAVTAAVSASISPSLTVSTIKEWLATEPSKQAASALLLLAILYVGAFVLFGLRDRILRFLSAGEFWLFGRIRKRRRMRFTQREIAKEFRLDGPALAVAQATTWVSGGYGVVQRQYVYVPRRTTAAKVVRTANALLRRIERRGIQQRVSAEAREELSRLFTALHRLAFLDPATAAPIIRRFQHLCASATPPIDVKAWCEDVKALDYGDIVAAYTDRVWSPPLREVQPTELGNILNWAYSYTRRRYGIELEFLFPRLLKVIDKDYKVEIDDRRQFLDFTILLTFLAFAAAGSYALVAAWSIVASSDKHAWQPILGATAVFGLWISLGRMSYGLSLVAAHGYVSIVTSAVDLFRLPLLEHLKISVQSETEEAETWPRLNTAILSGDLPGGTIAAPGDMRLLARVRRAWKELVGHQREES